MGNREYFLLCKVEDILIAKNYEFQILNNIIKVYFDNGDEIQVKSGENGVRFLLISGLPIKEPVAWHGPIVMNTQEELKKAIQELRSGNFIKTNMNES